MRAWTIRLTAIALCSVGAWVAYTQNPPRPATQKVKENLYLITGGGGNVAAYVTPDGVILVDDMYERNYEDVMGQLRTVTDKPVRYVLNTHQHDDHAGSNGKMLTSGVEVVAHKNARTNMVRLNQPGQPRLTFADEFAVHLGGAEVRALHFGRGHTNGDAIIYFPALKTIHTGDIFISRLPSLPFVDYANGGSFVEWTAVIDEISKLDFDTIIPGHGAISDRAGLARWRADLVKTRDRVHGLIRESASKDTISRVLIEEFKWPDGGLALQQVDALIAELRE